MKNFPGLERFSPWLECAGGPDTCGGCDRCLAQQFIYGIEEPLVCQHAVKMPEEELLRLLDEFGIRKVADVSRATLEEALLATLAGEF